MDFKQKYLKYKNKYLKAKIMYGGSRRFSIIDDIYIKKYDSETFVCDVMFVGVGRGTKHVAYVSFIRTEPEGNFKTLDETYFFTELEILKMKEQARKEAYPKIQHLFDKNILKKFYDRKPEIDRKLQELERNEEEEKQNKIRMEQFERERSERERIRKLQEEERERIRKLQEEERERIRKLEEEEREKTKKDAEEKNKKIKQIAESLQNILLTNNVNLAIEEYNKIEQTLSEDDKKRVKKIFYNIFFGKISDIKELCKKIGLLLDAKLITIDGILAIYNGTLIPFDVLELILSKSNEDQVFNNLFSYQLSLIKSSRKYSEEEKENILNNYKKLYDKYKNIVRVY